MEIRIPPEVLARGREHSGSDEELARFLRGEGLSKSLSVIAFSFIKGVSVAAAKSAIHFSHAWEAQRQFDERVQSAALDAAQSR